MTGDASAPITIEGTGRDLVAGGDAAPIRLEIRDNGFTVSRAGAAPVIANFRDVTTIAVDHGRLLLVLGGGAARFLLEAIGDRLGLAVSELRERRAWQMLHDRFIEVPAADRLELIEYRVGTEHGVAQIAYHPWGVALLPVDGRAPSRLIRRADIAAVRADPGHGAVNVDVGGAQAERIEVLALGAAFESHRARLAALRDGALGDAAAIVAALLPDAPFAVRQAASAGLVDGRPVASAQLGDAWPYVERAVLVDPVFAASYRALLARSSAGTNAASWLALAPRTPGKADEYMSWFLVGLPGNLIAFELVSGGAHATYLFRLVPRAQFDGEPPADALTQAVLDVSESLIDTRFLREPIYLTDAALADPKYVRYRFAIAALPTLRAARWRFVGRLIHSDDASWNAALDDAIRFNSSTRDDAAAWPGSASTADEQESD
jgi:hypothetical protein